MSDELRPFYVELTVGAVVMAVSEAEAMRAGEDAAREIVEDSGVQCFGPVAVQSLEHLKQLAPEWTADSVPYGGDGYTALVDLLPEETPFHDTRTQELF